MPKYTNEDLKGLKSGAFEPIYFNEFQEYYKKAYDDEHANLLFVCYISGLRPIEVKRLIKENFIFETNYIIIDIYTAKKGVKRRIYIPRIKNIIINKFIDYVRNLTYPKQYVFGSFVRAKNIRSKFMYLNFKTQIGRVNINGIFQPFSFYVFRHNIMTLLAENGADFIDLQIFKGAQLNKNLFGSASFYIHRSRERMIKISKILRKILK